MKNRHPGLYLGIALGLSALAHAGLLLFTGSEQRPGQAAGQLRLALLVPAADAQQAASARSQAVSVDDTAEKDLQHERIQNTSDRQTAPTSIRTPSTATYVAAPRQASTLTAALESLSAPPAAPATAISSTQTESDDTSAATAATAADTTPVAVVKSAGSEQRQLHQRRQLHTQLMLAFKPHFYYPRLAIRRGWQGHVTLGLQIEASGRLQNITVINSSGYSILDNAALASMRKVEQLPQASLLLNGDSMQLVLPVKFTLL